MEVRNIIKSIIPKSFLDRLKRIIIGADVNTYSFSQGGEDVILKNIFWNKIINKKEGFYIDIGAYHPIKGSNTFLFYKYGWSGINIDPNPYTISLFNKTRPRDINLQIAISDEEKDAIYYYYGETFSQNSLSKEFMLKFGNNADYKEIKLKTYRLDSILSQYKEKFTDIDFLNIDVEGLDFKVLMSNDWNQFRPKIVVIELEASNLQDIMENEASIFLTEKEYELYTRIPMGKISSVIYMDKRIKRDSKN